MTLDSKPAALPLQLILIEDSKVDAELVVNALREAGLNTNVQQVEEEADLRAALTQYRPDAILADWTLPRFSGLAALGIAHALCPEVPFIFVSGTISEAGALAVLRQGATDYVFKHQLPQLDPALTRALEEARTLRLVRESEVRYRSITDSVFDAIITADDNGDLVGWNPAAERIFGYSASEVLGQPLTQLIPARSRDHFLAGMQRARTGGPQHSQGKKMELTGLRKNANEFPIELAMSKWAGQDGLFLPGSSATSVNESPARHKSNWQLVCFRRRTKASR